MTWPEYAGLSILYSFCANGHTKKDSNGWGGSFDKGEHFNWLCFV